MKEQLITHIEQLFAGAALNRENLELKEEITRNTIERYEDLIAEGTPPEAAYRVATENIGDINELLHTPPAPQPPYVDRAAEARKEEERQKKKKKGRGPVYRSISGALTALGIVSYLLVSFATSAWHLTWLIFIITAAADNIVKAIFDLCKGGDEDEEE